MTETTDYSFFPSNVTGFSYDGDACNICQIPQTTMDTGGFNSAEDIYNSSNNKCKFTMSGDIPEAYNVYIGKYGNAPSESVPSSTTTTTDASSSSCSDYQKCISSCDSLKS